MRGAAGIVHLLRWSEKSAKPTLELLRKQAAMMLPQPLLWKELKTEMSWIASDMAQ